MPDATFVVDQEKRIVAWNRACEAMTGVPREELLGRGDRAYAMAFFGERRASLVDLLDVPSPVPETPYTHLERRGETLCGESFGPGLRGGEGAYLWGEATPLYGRDGKRSGTIEVTRDITDRKRIEMALQDSRERLLRAQRVARLGFLDWDLTTNGIFLSDVACELTGFTAEGHVATPEFVAQSVHPDDLEYVEKHLDLAIRGVKPYDIVHRHLRPDGSIVWVHAQAELSRDADGTPVRLLGTIVDITDQKRAEEALRESEVKYRTLFETADVAILLMARDRFIDCNARALSMFGCSREQLVGAPPYRFSPPVQSDGRDSMEKAMEKIEGALTEHPQFFEWEHRRQDGTPFSAEVSLNRMVLDGKVLLQAIVRDISDRKRIEKALIASEREYRELVMLANSIILRWSPDGHVTFLNEFGQRFFGYTLEEILGRHVIGTIVPESESTGRDLRPLMDEICTHPERFERNANENMLRNGERVWIDWTNKVVYDARGEIKEILSIGSDITERRRAEEQVRNLNQELQRHAEELEERVRARTAQLAGRNQELKEFTYTVSHDLKAPLRGIAGYANELARKHRRGLSDRAHFCLTQILTASSHLDQLIEELLLYSRLDRETPSATSVHLGDLVATILRDRSLTIKEQGVEVTVDIPFSTLRAWERGLTQALGNLIDNAVKYCRDADPPRLDITAASLDGVWRIAVKDNGIGFDMKYHDRIFGLFNRLVRMEDYEGTGAGLAIAKKVVEKQGGRIWAESAPGQGATFFLELPETNDDG